MIARIAFAIWHSLPVYRKPEIWWFEHIIIPMINKHKQEGQEI